MPRHAKHTKYERDENMIRGLRSHAAKLIAFDLGTGFKSPDAVAAKYQAHLDAMSDVTEKEIAWKLAVERERVLEAEIKNLHPRVQDYLRSHFGAGASALRRFGLKPAKEPTVPVKTKLRAIEKRRETRRLRGTMGKKQRRRIKGKVE